MRPGRDADHSPPSSAKVLEEKSYTSTQIRSTAGHVTGLLYLYLYHAYLQRCLMGCRPAQLDDTRYRKLQLSDGLVSIVPVFEDNSP